MSPTIFFSMLLFLLPLYLLLIACRKSSKKLPPGSLGFPIIGQTFSFLSAMRKNRAEEWLQDKKRKYGPISKMSLLGTPTVFVCGQAANKFIYTCDDSILANQQPSSIRRLCGERNILELSGHEHKRVRGALVSILKPEVLKQYVGKMDEEVRKHFKIHWHGKKKVLVGQFYQTTKYLHYIKMISAYYGKCPNFHCWPLQVENHRRSNENCVLLHFFMSYISLISLYNVGNAIDEDSYLQRYELTDIRNRAKCKKRDTCRALPTTAEGCSFCTNQFSLHLLQP